MIIIIFFACISCVISYIIKCYKDIFDDPFAINREYREGGHGLGAELSTIIDERERERKKKEMIE